MRDGQILTGSTLDEVAKKFSEEVGRQYRDSLDFWKATAMDDRMEMQMWERRLESEVVIVEKNAYEKILRLVKEKKLRKKYFLRKFLFKNKNILNITTASGFYNGLLQGRNIENYFSINVEYHIDMVNLCITKKVLA